MRNRMIAIMMLCTVAAYAQNKKQDTVKKAPPFVKELKQDSTKQKMPVQKLDTLKNNMPVAQPEKNVQPK